MSAIIFAIPLISGMQTLTCAHDIVHEWRFDAPGFSMLEEQGCRTRVRDGNLHGEIEEAHAVYVILPEIAVEAPVLLRFRARSEGTFGRGEVYWITQEFPNWGMDKFLRFSPRHDGAWHEYALSLPAVGTITHLRFALGWKPGVFEIDWMRLEADPYPPEITAAIKALPEQVGIENDVLRVALQPREHAYIITDKRTGRDWTADAKTNTAVLIGAAVEDAHSLVVALWDNHIRDVYHCTVRLSEGGVLTYELDTADHDAPFYGANNYPPAFAAELDAGKMLFCNRSSGVYVDLDEPVFSNMALAVYGNTECTDMPWVGVVDHERGDGYMALAETPWDAFFLLQTDESENAWPQIHWRESMDAFRYPRRFSYHFSDSGGYVALAKKYRDHAREQGLLKTLEEKAALNPNVKKLLGAPIIWGALDAWEFMREARTEGILRAVLANADHGLRDKSRLRDLNEMGYITLTYDSFTDIQDGETGFQTDNIEETAYHARPGLGPMGGWEDDLHAYATRSSAYALRALKTYVPPNLEKYGFNGRFIDVSMAIDLFEDHHPDHTFDRRQDLAYRREAFAWLNSLNLVLGAEHGNDWGIDQVAFTEGALSGPFWWRANRGWNPGNLARAQCESDYPAAYLDIGINPAKRIPLWQLVYQDCSVSAPYWGDTPGMHYLVRPDLSDRFDLFTLLYGGVPLFWRDRTDYDWSENRDRALQTVYDTCLFHKQVGFSEMLSHVFLDADGALQQTRFSSGHTATVNFSDLPRAIGIGEERTVLLAPRGFFVAGHDFLQSRLVEDGVVVTRIEAPGFRRYVAPDRRSMGPVNMTGAFTAFQVDDNRWQFSLAPDGRYEISPAKLTGWPGDGTATLLLLDGKGEARRILQKNHISEIMALDASAEHRYYALVRDMPPQMLVIYPTEPWVEAGEAIHISAADPDIEIRFTMDGNDSDSESPLYTTPLLPERSFTLQARPFKEDKAVGDTVTVEYRVVSTLFENGLMKGGDAAMPVDVPVESFAALRILVGHGGDSCWSDWANLGDAAFIFADHQKIYLSDLEPSYHRQTYEELGRDASEKKGERLPLTIAGRTFEKGLSTFSEAEIIYAVPAGAQRFVAWVGVDDRANPPPGAPEVLRGTVTFNVQGVTAPK